MKLVFQCLGISTVLQSMFAAENPPLGPLFGISLRGYEHGRVCGRGPILSVDVKGSLSGKKHSGSQFQVIIH